MWMLLTFFKARSLTLFQASIREFRRHAGCGWFGECPYTVTLVTKPIHRVVLMTQFRDVLGNEFPFAGGTTNCGVRMTHSLGVGVATVLSTVARDVLAHPTEVRDVTDVLNV